MRIRDVVEYLESWAPLSYQADYDNSGLLVGDPDWTVRRALICLDSTEEVIAQAVRKRCELVIAHHPIIFEGLKSLTGKNYVERAVLRAIRSNVAIYAMHTNLDHVHDGVNAEICHRLGIRDVEILKPRTGVMRQLQVFCPIDRVDAVSEALNSNGLAGSEEFPLQDFSMVGVSSREGWDAASTLKMEMALPGHLEARISGMLEGMNEDGLLSYDWHDVDRDQSNLGSGMVGELAQPMAETRFFARIKRVMKAPCIRHTSLKRKRVRRVAVCGGAGSSLLPEAIASGADMFVSSDFKYHQFFDAEDRIVIADIGHHEGERFTQDLLDERLRENFPNFAVSITTVNTNPVKYFT